MTLVEYHNQANRPMKQSVTAALAPLLDGKNAGKLIPELVGHGLQ
jgi:hypothetical protein